MSFAFLFLILIAVVGSSAMVAILGWMWNRMRQLEGGQENRTELANVSQQLDALRDHLLSVENEMTRLNDRVDFTEKLLEAPRAEPERVEPSDTP